MALTKASLIDLNSNELVLDLDADTSITADTDDTIHFKIAGSDEITMTAGAIAPSTSDGNALGTTSLMFSDLFLASGSVVNFNNGDVTLTHSSNTVTLAGGTLTLPDSGLVLNSTAVTSTAAEINLIDGGTSTGTTAVADADGIITNDGGTMRLTTAATFKTYFQEGISQAYDDFTIGDAAVLITTSSGNITIDAAANDSDIILKGTDGGVDTTFLTIDGSAAGAATFNAGIIVGGASQLNNAVTVGVDDTGYDVKFFGATSGKSLLWDESADTLIVTGNATISGTATTTGVHTFTAIPVFPNDTIETADIQADAITGAKIADDQIDSEHYVDGSIDTAHIAADQIVASLIADNAIDSEHYTDGSIDTAHIADDAVTSAKVNLTDELHINSTASGNTLHTLLKLETDGTADGSGITIDTRTAHTRGEINFLDGSGSYDSNYVFKTATGSQLAAPSEKFRVSPTGATVTGNLTNSGDIFLGTTSATNSAKMTSLFSRVSHIGFVSENNGGNDDTEHFRFKNGNGTIGNIVAGNTATAYNTSSDYRLKENVDYTWDATTRLKQLKPARFNFIADADLTVDGFIAHEVSSVVPEAIYGDKDGLEKNIDGTNTLDDDGNTIPKYQGIDQSKLVPLLVKTIQELEARITTLENA
jgi:hypothetical protein